MKQREPRLACIVKARMRLDGVWRDVCIRNISSRGMLLQAGPPPRRGTYLEVYRGRHVIVARVAWSSDNRFGIQTQDRLDVQAIITEPDLSAARYNDVLKTQPAFERRSAPRPTQAELRWRAERSRFRAKALEFACVAAVTGSVGLVIFDTVSDRLTSSVAGVSAGLSGDAGSP